MSHDGGNIDQRSPAGRLEQVEPVARDADDTIQIDLADPCPIRVRQVTKVRPHVESGIIDDDIQATVLCCQCAVHGIDVLSAGHIDGHRIGLLPFSPDHPRGRLGALAIHIRETDVGALGREPPRDTEPKASGSPRDQCDASF